MSTQTGSISFESTKGIHNYAKQNFSTLSQVLGQFATCGTGASTTAKVATIVPENSNWTLQEGTTVTVTFSSANTTTTPTLNVNGTGAKQIRDSEGNELTKAAREWAEGAAIAFTYDGTYWRIQDSNLMERVHTAETEINQTANNVLIKATENDTTAAQGGQHLIESFINVAPSGVTISADKVNIEGATIFTGNGRLSQTSLNNVYATKDDLADVSSGAELTKSMSEERTIITEDAADLPLLTLDPVYGESVQNGTPTPDTPIYIQALKSPHRFPGGDTLEVTIPGRSEDNKEIWGNYSGSATRTLRSDGTYERTYTGIYQGIGITFYGKTSLSVGDEFYVSCSFRNDSSVNISIAIYCMELDSSGTRVYTGLLVNGTGTSAGWGTVEAGTEKRFTMKCVWTQSCQDLLNNGGCIRLTIQKKSSGNDPITMFHPMINMGSSVQDWTPEGHLGIISKSGDNQVLDITYLNLQGNELHGLNETYRDILHIDANGHATIEKRTEKVIIDGSITPGNFARASGYYARFWYSQAIWESNIGRRQKFGLGSGVLGYFKSSSLTPIGSSAYGSQTKAGIIQWNDPSANFIMTADVNSAIEAQTFLQEHPTTLVYPIEQPYIIDLGYIDLPQVTDNSTVYVAAEIQPVISGSWWTKAGEFVGQLAQQNKNNQGTLEAPYTEVEWVESNGTQYVYTDWNPPIETWGFDIEFLNKNATTTSVGAWRSDTNINGYGTIFGTRNASNVNNTQLSSYNNGVVRVTGNSNTSNHGFKTDKSKQHMSYIGTTFTKPDNTTMTVNRGTTTANKFYANMTIFACHEGLRRAGTGNLIEPSTTRIYSLKFYENTEVVMDLVGAIRNRDGMTGLYDKVKNHFYPAPNMTYGNTVGVLGESDTIAQTLAKRNISVLVDNRAVSRMWYAKVPDLDKLEDGQQITVTTMANIGGSKPELTDLELYWDEIRNNSNAPANVYLKLELADGSTTEWIPCYYAAGTRLTSHYNSGVPVLLTYREDVFYGASTTSAGTSVMRGFWADPSYNSDTQYDKFSDSVIAGKNGIKRYTLCMKDDVGNWTSIVNQANNTAVSGKTCYTGGLQLGKILYAASDADYAAGANSGVMAQTYPGFDFRYSVNGVQNAAATELQLRKPIYLVGELDEDTGLFYLDTTKWWTQTEPTAEDGKTYILMGSAYGSYYAAFLAAKNPTYKFINGKFQNLEDLAVQETHKIYYRTTAASNKPSAGPSTWVTTATNVYNTWTTKVPPLANSTDSSTSGYTKYPFLYTCEQRRLANNTIECTNVTLDENTTVIDGGSIITNSITASKISVDNLAAINSNLGTLTAGTIDASKVTVNNIDATKITSGDIAAARIQTNLISAIDAKVSDISALSATLGGFQVDNSAIHTKNVAITSNADNSIALSSADFTRTINGTSRAGLRLAIGDKFGVTGDGAIYASSVDLTGKITATSGTIGGCTISNGVLQVANANITGTISGNKINASEINIGDLSGEIGGRNLFSWPLTGTKWKDEEHELNTYQNRGSFTQFTDSLLFDPLETIGEQYTISFDVKSPNGTTNVTLYNSNGNPSAFYFTSVTVAQNVENSWIHCEYTITNTAYSGTGTANAAYNRRIEIYAPSAIGVLVRKIKVEKGSCATDWTPAPEDVAATATNYIHADSTGINIYDSSIANASKYYLRQTAGGTYIYRNSYLKAKYEDTITLYGGSNASGANPKVELTSSQFKMTDSGGVQRLLLDSSSGAIIGKPDKGRIQVTDTSMTIYDTNNKKRTTVDASGLHVFDASSTPVEVALFGSTVGTTGTAAFARIGKSDSSRFEISPTTLSAYTGNTKYFEVSASGLTWGNNVTAASQSYVTSQGYQNSTQVTNLIDTNQNVIDAKKHTQVIISATNVNYVASGTTTAASLTATLYIDGVATTTNVTYQWYKDGTEISTSTASTAKSRTLTVTGTMGLTHLYTCKCGF